MTVTWALCTFALPPAVAWAVWESASVKRRQPFGRFVEAWLLYAASFMAVTLLYRDRDGFAGASASALAALAVWLWRRRGDVRRVLGLAGEKSRARLAALVRGMPRTAPRLAPQGVA